MDMRLLDMAPIDLQLLEAATLMTFYPKSANDRQRAERLAANGYLKAASSESRGSGLPPPSLGYQLTQEGKLALKGGHPL
jgi:hypothetical protein